MRFSDSEDLKSTKCMVFSVKSLISADLMLFLVITSFVAADTLTAGRPTSYNNDDRSCMHHRVYTRVQNRRTVTIHTALPDP